MKVNVHGSSHSLLGVKNQDSCLEISDGTRRLKLVCDGCTNIDPKNPETYLKTHNEVGSGLFCSKYSLIEDPFNHEKFVENANNIMKKMLDFIDFSKEKYLKNEKMIEFISYNYSFTIFACFETEEHFYVYHLGDGVIIVQNLIGNISYIERKFGKYPPYLVNNFIFDETKEFTKITFSKKDVKNVGVASDGIMAITKNMLEDKDKKLFDSLLSNDDSLSYINQGNAITNFINSNNGIFSDDTTIVF